ncbi:MAG TPA: cation:proton antiporter [Gemmatimonadaceae bacterium]|nr:cation:proton antiporter [Gemmatimonadaceae bacterium]
MHEAHEFLRSLALVLCVAAVTTVLFQRLRQPVVFGYLFAGMIVGPHIPLPVVANEPTVEVLAELGVILLMFGLGLEFSLRKLIQVGATAGLVAVAQSSAMVWFGYLVGQLFGWTQLESVYAGAVIAISSTTIIIKAFQEQGVGGRVRELVFGVLIIEDLIGIFLIAILTAVSTGGGVSAGSLATTAGRLATFLAGLIGVGLLIVPRLVRFIVRLNRPETTLVASVGISFAAALLAQAFGYSVALGAFIAGSLVAESGVEKTVEHLVGPVRDMFAAIFFVAVGMLINPGLIAQHWQAVVVLTLVVILGKVLAVSVSAFLTGSPVRLAVQTGMSLAQIGEFSFIIASVGLATGATRGFLYPVAIAVSAFTTLTTPWLIRGSAPTAAWVDRRLPKPLQTFVALYGSWLERMRSAPREEAARSRTRRQIRMLLVDALLVAAVVIGVALEQARAADVLARLTNLAPDVARLVVLAGGAVVLVPLVAGIIRTARRLGLALALRAIPAAAEGAVDLGAAPRRVLVVTLQLGVVLLVGAPLVAVTQPFVPPLRGAAVFMAVLALLGIAFWRSATNLQGHARAGAELIVATLAQQMSKQPQAVAVGAAQVDDAAARRASLAAVNQVLPGLGEPVSLEVPPESPAVDRTLADLNLRGLTGATVLAITRNGQQVLIPTGHERLRAGDLLALAGTQEAVSAAERLLRSGE